MSLWDKIKESISIIDRHSVLQREESRDSSRYAFVDIEVGLKDGKIHDIGALRWDGAVFHSNNSQVSELTLYVIELTFFFKAMTLG